MFVKNNVNDMILKMKQNEKNFQTIFRNMERKIDEWEKSQNVSSEQTDRIDPPPPPADTEHVNVVFTKSGKFSEAVPLPNLLGFLLRRLHSDAVLKILTSSLVRYDAVARNRDAVSMHCT
ncbi:hypothetical protein Tco_0145942 [Tanacetum coccineum]